jgi:hypothetical protein
MNFRTFVLLLTVTSIAIAIVSAQTAPVHKPAPKKAAVTKAVTKKAPAPVQKTGTTPSRTTAKKRAVTKRAPSPARPSAPTPDRYKQIQEALATKGYLKSEPNGVWDANSMDAMKRYQADEKQEPSGKLTAASLIGLGLGPKTALMSTGPPADVPAPPVIVSVPMP